LPGSTFFDWIIRFNFHFGTMTIMAWLCQMKKWLISSKRDVRFNFTEFSKLH
jgi:hypothetical protein